MFKRISLAAVLAALLLMGAAPVHAVRLTSSIAIADPADAVVGGQVAFNVTRSVADGTVYWVYNTCYDASGAQVAFEGYPVLWPSPDSLSGGTYPYVFTLAGTHCKALVTISPWNGKPLGNAVITYVLGV